MVSSGFLELCYNVRILLEYQSVLIYKKFLFDKAHLENLLEQIEACGHITTGKPPAERLQDIDDEPFLEVALGAMPGI